MKAKGRGFSLKHVAATVAIAALVIVWLVIAGRGPSGHAGAEQRRKDTVSVSDAGKRLLQIRTDVVRLQAFEGTVQATGQVCFPLDETVHISPRLQGRVRQVLVQVGDRVTKGQTLAVMDSVDAVSAEANVMQSDNKMRLAKRNVEREGGYSNSGRRMSPRHKPNRDQARAHTQFTKDALDRKINRPRSVDLPRNHWLMRRTTGVGAVCAGAGPARLAGGAAGARSTAKLVDIGVGAKRDLDAAEDALQMRSGR